MNPQRLAASSPKSTRRGPFVILITALLLAIFLAGFSKNFYLRAWWGQRPLTVLAYAHGFLMTIWLGLFVAQVTLVARARSDIHRRLGEYGAWAACGVVFLGIATILAAVGRHEPSANVLAYAKDFVAFDGLSLLLFGGLVGYAYRVRGVGASHRRLMLMSLITLLPPAYGRIVEFVRQDDVPVIVLSFMIVSALVCIAVDYAASKRLHAAILWPSVAIIAVNIATFIAQQSD